MKWLDLDHNEALGIVMVVAPFPIALWFMLFVIESGVMDGFPIWLQLVGVWIYGGRVLKVLRGDQVSKAKPSFEDTARVMAH